MFRFTKLASACLFTLTAAVTMSCHSPSTQTQQMPLGSSEAEDAALLRRADALIAQMTLEEKAGQLNLQFVVGPPAAVEAQIRAGEAGGVLFVSDPKMINRLQKIAIEESRLKIPLIAGFDVIHGFRTIFPAPIGVAGTFDPGIARKSQTVAAAEARAAGIHWAFAPMLDVARDARWGRMVEGAGEDPFLGAQMAKAQVQGFQGERLGMPGRVIAGPKHFMGYAAALGGRDYDSVQVSDSDLYNLYLPPFAAAIDAGAGNVMSAYMDLNDIPAVANRWLLTDLLRTELGFKGWVVSDANGVGNQLPQHFAEDAADAARRAVEAGNDMAMAFGPSHVAPLAASIREGKFSEAVLDQAVRRILMAKLRLGLFEHPYVDVAQSEAILADRTHREVAQEAAEKSLTLLKNQDGILPLRIGAHRSIAVIGPLADSGADILGPWVFQSDPKETVTPYAGIKSIVGTSAKVETAPGVELRRNFPSPFEIFFGAPPPAWTPERARSEFERAVDLAKSSDVIVLVVGETAAMSGEKAARADLRLGEGQERLFDAAMQTGKPVIVVLVNGRPLDIRALVDRAPAILESWYPGTRGGTAIARALFGEVNPGGKLPVTWPRSTGQVPIFYSHNSSHSPADTATRYLDEASTPLFPFGYGLSYTSFEIGAPTLSSGELAPSGAITVTAMVVNTGTRAGDEVVQLYLHQRSGRASRPVRELKGFERVTLRPGESRSVSFTVNEDSIKYWNAAERTWVIDPSVFDVWIGSDSIAGTAGSFRALGAPRNTSRPIYQ